MKNVAFFDNSFSFRGTTRALIDYAKIAKEELGWSCDILYNINSRHNSAKFLKHCINQAWPITIKGIQDPYGQFRISALSNYDNIYFETVGIDEYQKKFLDEYKGNMLLHQIGNEKPYLPSNYKTKSYYCSYWQSFYFSGGATPVLPYLIDKKELTKSDNTKNLRKMMDIPENHIVLGRHGGVDTWNLEFVNDVLVEIVQKRNDLSFIFVNTPKFINHPQFIFIDTMIDRKEIISYIKACDAMIHARWEGETFGLACAEFLVNKKPIITWSGSRERSHIYFADRSVIMYNQKADLIALLLNLDKKTLKTYGEQINLDLYEDCTNTHVSRIFKKVFDP